MASWGQGHAARARRLPVGLGMVGGALPYGNEKAQPLWGWA